MVIHGCFLFAVSNLQVPLGMDTFTVLLPAKRFLGNEIE